GRPLPGGDLFDEAHQAPLLHLAEASEPVPVRAAGSDDLGARPIRGGEEALVIARSVEDALDRRGDVDLDPDLLGHSGETLPRSRMRWICRSSLTQGGLNGAHRDRTTRNRTPSAARRPARHPSIDQR